MYFLSVCLIQLRARAKHQIDLATEVELSNIVLSLSQPLDLGPSVAKHTVRYTTCFLKIVSNVLLCVEISQFGRKWQRPFSLLY